ncbi:4a-hydroxytetrahydrobiopterin dehydratase [Polynucleobacter sp. AP-Kolm-20A-A1]|uniref:4a-hydroxytetrahydrobiopterin dehydratase n=1 Tax=Polynucleobacter sp. AP-Kolm-20A-A1 TaxID=2081041 RepID=UPI001BFDEDF3|nr:4a-hydroxytetrahydrobiopterin dehydratase [Polynucleobacter sp. AP-Kolm-20A-A1]QWE20984.1 4a-hydroxytetrahydrobiopterin dehydratase [Polynucleobacter sp. AP-Kolm-20A-A1]
MNSTLLPLDYDFEGGAPLWERDINRKMIGREFIFKDFEQAFQFMTLSAQYAQEIDHHPDWSNSWNRVMVSLTTHSAGGLTQLDIKMAQAMNQFAEQINS